MHLLRIQLQSKKLELLKNSLCPAYIIRRDSINGIIVAQRQAQKGTLRSGALAIDHTFKGA